MRPQHIPESEIRLAAKFGFLSKPIWDEFFAEGRRAWRARQWQHLHQRDFFRRHPSNQLRDVLVLNPKNSDVLKIIGEEISSPPFVAHFEHDSTMANILLHLDRSGVIASYKVEAELKRQDVQPRKVWDESERSKYPDALVQISVGGRIQRIAFELELSRKSPKRYRQILNSYASRLDCDMVVYLSDSKPIFDSLKNAMQATAYPSEQKPLGFGRLRDWRIDPSKAKIHFSDRVSSLTELSTRA